MPTRAPRICACGRVVAYGVKCACQMQRDKERKAAFDRTRPSASARGYDSKWREAREGFLAKHPTCACGAPATIVNHIIPHKGDKRLFWDRSNWEPMCKPCHDGPTQSKERRRAFQEEKTE